MAVQLCCASVAWQNKHCCGHFLVKIKPSGVWTHSVFPSSSDPLKRGSNILSVLILSCSSTGCVCGFWEWRGSCPPLPLFLWQHTGTSLSAVFLLSCCTSLEDIPSVARWLQLGLNLRGTASLDPVSLERNSSGARRSDWASSSQGNIKANTHGVRKVPGLHQKRNTFFKLNTNKLRIALTLYMWQSKGWFYDVNLSCLMCSSPACPQRAGEHMGG